VNANVGGFACEESVLTLGSALWRVDLDPVEDAIGGRNKRPGTDAPVWPSGHRHLCLTRCPYPRRVRPKPIGQYRSTMATRPSGVLGTRVQISSWTRHVRIRRSAATGILEGQARWLAAGRDMTARPHWPNPGKGLPRCTALAGDAGPPCAYPAGRSGPSGRAVTVSR
jgi:hypothetical protein